MDDFDAQTNEWDDYGDEEQGYQNYSGGDYRNNRYRNAFGGYTGGYGNSFRGPQRGQQQPLFNFGPGPSGPRFGQRPMFMWGRGYGPGGPPMKRNPQQINAIKYLTRCGMAKDNLVNLPMDFLVLIQPQFCGVCAINFESFTMSRMHYSSKNHLKNQRKWLNQKCEAEKPIKSREFYCELCDVHITSKVHAESHYLGKPHRAVVEGFRNPKNTTLLQEGMEKRLQQLIRRERRFYKKKESKLDAEKPVQEVKKGPPELYCDICKTSVSCTDQMTMHLNGKRHLSREKQHILRMMSGPPETPAASDAQEGNGQDANEEADDGNEEEEESYDWGNGSGTWDEPAADDTQAATGNNSTETGKCTSSGNNKEEDSHDWGEGGGNWDDTDRAKDGDNAEDGDCVLAGPLNYDTVVLE